MNFQEITEKEYTSFLNNHPLRTFLHTPNIAKMRAIDGWEHIYLGIKNNNKIIAATMLLSRNEFASKKEFYAIRGFLIDYNNYELLKFFTTCIKKYIRKNNGFILRIDPYIMKQQRDVNGDIVQNGINNKRIIENLRNLGFKERNPEQVKWMFTLDIENKTLEQILKDMKPNTRNYINKTFKENLIIRTLKYDELDKFVKITDNTSKRRNFANKGIEYNHEMYKLFGDEVKYVIAELDTEDYLNKLNLEYEKENNTLKKLNNSNSKKFIEQQSKVNILSKRINEALLLKEKGSKIPLAASMFMLYGYEIIYLFSGNYKEYMNLHAQYRIQYEMIKYGIENGYKIYNFYGISGNFDPDDDRYGIYAFKKGFNGTVVELIGEYDIPVNKIYYFLYKIINLSKKGIKKIIKFNK